MTTMTIEQQQHPLFDDDLLAHILGFASGDSRDYLNLILVSRRWKRVSDEYFLREYAILGRIQHSNRAALRENDLCWLLRQVFESLKCPKSLYYHQQGKDGEDQWPKLECRICVTFYAFVYDSCYSKCEGKRQAMYWLIKAFIESLAAQVVERMLAVAASVTPPDTSTCTPKAALWKEWQRWSGIMRNLLKVVAPIEKLLGCNDVFPNEIPDEFETLEVLVNATMANSVVQFMTVAPEATHIAISMLRELIQDSAEEKMAGRKKKKKRFVLQLQRTLELVELSATSIV